MKVFYLIIVFNFIFTIFRAINSGYTVNLFSLVELPSFAYLKEKFYVKKIAVFGSILKEDFNSESDIDLYIEFEKPIGTMFIQLIDFLETILKRKVDVLTPGGLKTIRILEIKKKIEQSLKYV